MMRHTGCLLSALLLASSAGAQAVLQLPGSTRALGVGNAFVAGRGSDVIFYNPALLSQQPGLNVAMQRFGDASTLGGLSSSFSGGAISAGVGAQWLDYSVPGTGIITLDNLGSRLPVAASSLSAILGVASEIKGLRVGLAAKFVEERTESAHDGTAAFDLGLSKDLATYRTTLGLSVQHLGGNVTLDGEDVALPAQTTLGAATSIPPFFTFFDLNAIASVSYRHDGNWIPAGGIELTYVPLDGWALTGRIGARHDPNGFGAKPLTLGAGLAFDRLGVEYAWHALEGGTAAHRVGVRLR